MSYCQHSDREGQRGGAASVSPNEIQWSSECSPIPLGRAPILFRRDLPVHGAALLSPASSSLRSAAAPFCRGRREGKEIITTNLPAGW